MAVTKDTATVVGVFSSVQDANEAVRHLENQGFGKEEVSLVCNKDATGYDRLSESDKSALADKTSDVVADAGIGAAIGGIGGLLLSLAGVAIPGIGPVLAAGPIAAALTGAGIGAAGGGLIGALTETGVPEEHANYYSEAVRRGHVLLTVRASGERAERAAEILDQHGAVDVDERVSNWRERGWSGKYDSSDEPYSREQLEHERSFYGSTMAGASGYMDDNTHTARTMDRTGDFENTRPGVQEGTWSRDTERGAGIGLGRDPLGREMREDATLGVADRHDSGTDASDRLRRGADRAGDKAEEWTHRAGEKAEHLGHRIQEGAERAGHRVEEAWDKMTGQDDRHLEKAGHRVEEGADTLGNRMKEFGRGAENRLDERRRSRVYRGY